MAIKSEKLKHNLTLAVFITTLFLSAALMFSLQPMVGKMLLPIVGGTPAGWIVAMAFFQIMLLVGYFLAHALAKFTPRTHAALYLVSLGLGCFFLPIALNKYTGLISSNPVAIDIFILLSFAVAVPFIAISATASTIQRLFTITDHKASDDPYFLYAASNLGSFSGLLLYPFYIEPKLTLTNQSYNWVIIYLLLFALTIFCLSLTKKETPLEKNKKQKAGRPIGWKRKAEWIVLSLIPSGLLLAVTNHITTDVFSAPLLWVIPLSLYLLTFIIAFSKKQIIPYSLILKIQPLAVSIAVILATVPTKPFSLSWYALPLHITSFTIIALMCHMRLANRRPSDNNSYLTDFYLMISIGGALGGVINAFITPAIFNNLYEYPIFLILSVLLNENIKSKINKNTLYSFLGALFVIALYGVAQHYIDITEAMISFTIITVFALITYHPKTSFAGSLILLTAVMMFVWIQNPVLITRNFYGVIKVYDRQKTLTNKETVNIRYMQHGTTLHGYQILDKKYNKTATSYYSKTGPLNDIISINKPKQIAAIGLGTGTVNCYSTPNNKITFFEIDPDVIKMAKENFTFLSECGYREPKIIYGDARLELNKLKNQKFDLIILDAFSSDTVPTHLLTKEAMELYLKHLNKNGVIAMHISNRYFVLEKPITATAQILGLKNAHIYKHKDIPFYANKTKWMVLSKNAPKLEKLKPLGWNEFKANNAIKPWTDDYTDLIGAIKFK